MCPGPLGHAVLDRVLHERLQDQVRHHRVERVRLDVETDDESIGVTGLLDLEILGGESRAPPEAGFPADRCSHG